MEISNYTVSTNKNKIRNDSTTQYWKIQFIPAAIPSETTLKKYNSPYYHDNSENEASVDGKSEDGVALDDTTDNKMAAAIQSDASVDGKSSISSTNTSNASKSNFKVKFKEGLKLAYLSLVLGAYLNLSLVRMSWDNAKII